MSVVTKSYDIVCANISADVILFLTPEFPRFLNSRGMLILSGIISNRKEDIVGALLDVGLSVAECKDESGWICIMACPGRGLNPVL